jgi:hypothetical protein
MGTQEAAAHAERWNWIVVTRKPGELLTYVDGRLCASVKLEAPKKDKEEAKKAEEEAQGGGEDKAAGPKPQLQEKFVIDPQFLALFAVEDAAAGREGAPAPYDRRLWTASLHACSRGQARSRPVCASSTCG